MYADSLLYYQSLIIVMFTDVLFNKCLEPSLFVALNGTK